MSMTKSNIRIGLIGGGAIVRQRHLPGLRKLEGVEVVAVCNRRPESTRRLAQEFAIPRVADDWRDIVAMDDLDVIWVGTTPYMHCPITIAALEAGKHVFCQSRMCMDLDEARGMAAAGARHPDCVVRFCPPPMGLAGDRTMQRLLHHERLVGDIRQVHLTSVNGSLLDPHGELTWRLQKEQSGQNMMTLGIYFEVLDRWLGPTPRMTAVSRTWTKTRIHPDPRLPTAVEIPESVNVIAELASGAVGIYCFNGVNAHGPSDHLAVYGTAGTLVYHFSADENTEWIEGARRGEPRLQRIPIPEQERRTWTVEAEFIRAVRTGQCDPILPDLQCGLRYMNLVNAVHRSAAESRAIGTSCDG